MPNYSAEAIGTVEIVQSNGAQLYDVNGNALPTRVCPDGTLASTYCLLHGMSYDWLV